MAYYYAYGTENPHRVTAEVKAEEVTQPLTYTYIPPGHPSRQPPPQPQHTFQPVYYSQYTQYYPQYQSPYPPFTHDPNAAPYYAYPPAAPQPMYQFPYPPTHAAHIPAGTPWMGPTREEVDRQTAAAAQGAGSNKPRLMVPFDDNPNQRMWVRELDGSYTLRSYYDITENLKPGEGGEFRPGQTDGTYYFHCVEKK